MKGLTVTHKKFGQGIVVNFRDDKYIEVDFNGNVINLSYPDCFVLYGLSTDDKEVINAAKEAFELKKQLEKQQREEEEKRRAEMALKKAEEEKAAIQSGKKKVPKRSVRRNIAFKCNYCDGGKELNGIGFCAACSEDMMKYHVLHKQHPACMNSPCHKYLNGEMPLDEVYARPLVCYESVMCKNWRASAGWALKTKRPERIVNAQKNSLCVLTTNELDDSGERYVFGAFIIDTVYPGDDNHEGYVEASQNAAYKVSLTLDEAKQIKFWDYYQNPNKPESKQWGQGLFRYLDDNTGKNRDDIAMAILKKIIKVKAGKADESAAINIYDKFCQLNDITAEN